MTVLYNRIKAKPDIFKYLNDLDLIAELLEIFKLFVKKSNFKIEDKALIKAKNIFEKHLNDDNFGNARFARNLYEKCVINHATNCKDIANDNRLKTITEEDIIDI